MFRQSVANWPPMKDVKEGIISPIGFGKIKVHSKSGRIGRVVGEIKSPRIMLRLRFANGVEESFSWGELHPPTKEQAHAFERAEAKPLKKRSNPFAIRRASALAEY